MSIVNPISNTNTNTNTRMIPPNIMNQFPYLLLGNVYFSKTITVSIGMLIGENTVICSEVDTLGFNSVIENGMQVDFLPFNNGDMKLFPSIKGTVRLLKHRHHGLMLIILSEPIGRVIAQLFKNEDNDTEALLTINSNGLFSFMDEHLNINDEMTEMRCNGFLEDSLSVIGYIQSYDANLFKRTSRISYRPTLTSTFGHCEDVFNRKTTHYMFGYDQSDCNGNCYGNSNSNSNSGRYSTINNEEEYLLYEKKAVLITNEDMKDDELWYKIESFNCQKGTPLFIRRCLDNKKTQYVLLGFHLYNAANKHIDNEEIKPLGKVLNNNDGNFNSDLSKGVLFNRALYNDILITLNQSNKQLIMINSSFKFTKPLIQSTHFLVNYYFYYSYTGKGLISKNLTHSSIVKTLNSLYDIPEEYFLFTLGSPEVNEVPLNVDSSIDKSKVSSSFAVNSQEELYEINIFCEINMNSFSQFISNGIINRLRNVKIEANKRNKLLFKVLMKEIKRYETLSSHFYGLLYNEVKTALIH